ncbi:hypothetical protein BH09VER1_BH09VER1_02340 [soil metagenome]
MDVLDTLSVALGLATLAGLNLYLTVLVTGMAVHFHWLALKPELHDLAVLGEPWVIGIAGVLYLLQFAGDKVPWIDTANDAIHTVIRPIGGAMLAVLALGDAHPGVKVAAALLAGGAALTVHAAKAGTRLVANASPEPISNIGLSLGEDALVLGGLALINAQPVIALGLAILVLVAIWFLIPKLLKNIRATMWLAWRKLNGPLAGQEIGEISTKLPGKCELALRRAHATTELITVAVRCVSGGGPRLPRNSFGWLARFEGGRVFFVSPRWGHSFVMEIPMTEATVERMPRFLSEQLSIRQESGVYVFLFERGHRLIADVVQRELSAKPVAKVEPALAGV